MTDEELDEELAKIELPLCPICDGPLDIVIGYYGGNKCPHGHYEESAGNYHVDFYVNGEWVAIFDEMTDPQQRLNLKVAIEDARAEWGKPKKKISVSLIEEDE